MRKKGMRLVLLGGFAGAVLVAGCSDNPYDYGRKWSLTAQEDYYSEQAQTGNEAASEYSNIGTSATLFETDEQERGTGGAGEADAASGDNELPRIQGSKQAPEHLWLQQDLRVPFPPPELDAAMELGTGRQLQVGANGAWVQGTRAVEMGSGRSSARSTTSSSFEPEEPRTGTQSLPNEPASESPQPAPRGQVGQPPAPEDE